MADPADTPTNPAAVVEQVEKLALALLNDHRNCYGCWGCRPILEAALHEAILLGIEQGRAEMREEAAKQAWKTSRAEAGGCRKDYSAGMEWAGGRIAQAIRAIPTAKERG